MRVEYNSNNSGGEWWLKDEDWLALEAAGWKVDWCRDDVSPGIRDGRFLGALATSATREGLSLQQAVAEWERVTGELSEETGCPCCGQPHSFSLYDDDGEYLGGSEA